MRYLAAGENLVEHGASYNAPAGYDPLGIEKFPEKPYAYPSQLLQILLGGLVRYAGMSPNISTLIAANALAFIVSLFLLVSILRTSMSSYWAIAGATVIVLAVPQYRTLTLNFATEPWMMVFILATLLAIIRQRYFLAGACLGLGFFFRAQIVSVFPAALIATDGRPRQFLRMVAGNITMGAATWIVLKLLFPSSGESTSGFYGRVFLDKYTLDPQQAWQVVASNSSDFAWLWFSTVASIMLCGVIRLIGLSGIVRTVSSFYMASTLVMVGFALYMAGTVGDGVSDRYFVHLICLFWLTVSLALARLLEEVSWPVVATRVVPALLTLLLLLTGITQVRPAEALANIFAEDFPKNFFSDVASGSIIMTSYGAPVISLHVDAARVVYVPPLETFRAGKNGNVDFIFLDAKADSVPEDWRNLWDATKLTDNAGATFEWIRSFDSPLRSSRLFRRIRPLT